MAIEFLKENYRRTNWSEQFRGFRNAIYLDSAIYFLAALFINTFAEERSLLLSGVPAGLKGLHLAAERVITFIKEEKSTQTVTEQISPIQTAETA